MRDGVKSVFKLNKYLFLENRMSYIGYGLMSFLWCFTPVILAFFVDLLLENLSVGQVQRYFLILCFYTIVTYLNIYYARKSGIVEAKITSYVEKTLQLSTLKRVLQEKECTADDVGKMVDVLENDFSVLETMLLVQLEFLCNIVSFLGTFVIVLRINVYLTLFAFLPIVVVSSLIGYFSEKIKDRFLDARESSIGFSVMISDIIENHEIFQFIANKESVKKTFVEKCSDRGKTKIKNSIYISAVNHFIVFINNLSALLIMALVVFVPQKAALSVGALTLFVNSINNGFSFLQLYNQIVMSVKMTESSMERVCTLLHFDWKEMPEYLGKSVKLEAERVDDEESNTNVVFEHFRMCKADEPHSFTLKQGELMVISGGNASGKSYLLNCVAGYQSYEGKIKVGNSSNTQFGYLPQNVTLFDASLKENVTMFDVTENPEPAFEVGNLKGNMGNWNVTSENSIGVNGKSLSEGQRQRTAIARAVLNGKNILLMDEPFLFLDKENRKIILKNIKELKRTMILVSNDENVIKEADVHLVLEERKIRRVVRVQGK